MPNATAALAAALASALPWYRAVTTSVLNFVVPWSAVHDACGPTQSGSSFQPWPTTAPTQPLVRFGCAQPLLAPPMYTPMTLNGDACFHEVIVVLEGAAHVSNPFAPGVGAELVGGVVGDVGAGVLTGWWSTSDVVVGLGGGAGGRHAPSRAATATTSARRER